jgi:hypothetical protein
LSHGVSIRAKDDDQKLGLEGEVAQVKFFRDRTKAIGRQNCMNNVLARHNNESLHLCDDSILSWKREVGG